MWKAFRAYRPALYGGDVTFLRASQRAPDYCDPIPIWAAAIRGRFSIRDIPGDHFTMIREPHVDVLAAWLARVLSQQAGASAEVSSRATLSTARPI